MNKKIQVVIPFWLDEFIDSLTERADLNVSEFVRLHMCAGIISITESLYPEYKPGFSLSDFRGELGAGAVDEEDRERLSRAISKIYFEARKAAEFRLEKEKKGESNRGSGPKSSRIGA
jgi:hypothetical protein